jgi:tetratricopeptide (TPR) repeat protein
LRAAYEALCDLSTPEVAALAAQLGRIEYFHATDETSIRQALGPIDRALEIGEAERLGDVLSDAMNTKSLIMDSLHRPEESTALLQHALNIALEYEAVSAALRAYTNLSNLMWSRERYAEARLFQDRGRELAQRTGYRGAWWFLTGHISQLLYVTGAWDELEELWRESDPHRDEPAAELGLISIDYCWGLVQGLARGDVDEFVRLVEPYRRYEHGGDFQGRNFVDVMLSQIALLRETPEEAIERTERVLDNRDVLGSAHWEFKAGVELALQAALAVKDVERAESVVARVGALPRGERTPELDGTIRGYGARTAARRGEDTAEIEEGFRAAERIFLEIGDPFRRAQHLLAHAEWLATTGRSDEALVVGGQAAEIFRTLRATPWIECAEKLAPAVVVS